jgi:hypothetical protein
LPRFPLSLLFLASFAITLTSALALSQVQLAVLGVDAIKPGMRGYGLTVFRGSTPERFGVEVIDVLHKFRPDQDLILIRTEHPILERAITVAGMSGSPIYLDDKLIGAYAYGWTFGKEPLAGVTPIANMLAEIGRPIDPRIWKALGTLPLLARAQQLRAADPVRLAGLPAYDGSRHEDAFSLLRSHARRSPPLPSSDLKYGQPLPAATPLLVSGAGPRALELWGREFESFGLWPVQAGAGGGAAPSHEKPRFVDGGSIGVQLVRGDVNVMAVGTVTHVAGRRLVAFGHPMLNAGQVGLATCTARVVHIFASEQRSFKLAEPSQPLGTLIHDRQAAIVVDDSLKADMLPVRLHLHGVSGAARTEWNMEVANNRLLAPGLLLGAIVNALEASVADRNDSMLQLRSQVSIARHGEQVTEDFAYSPNGAADSVAIGRMRLFNVLSAAYGNPFEDARVTGIDLDLSVRFGRTLETIIDAQTASDTVDPGRDVALIVTLKRYDESERIETINVPIPASAAGESVELSVDAGDEIALDQPKPDSLNDLLAAVRAGYPGTSLVVSAKLPSQGIKLRGQIVRDLPGSALDSFQPVNEADRGSLFPTYQRIERPLGAAVTGSVKLKLNVRAEALR